ncbi:hypothetical protein [Bradyrhizobium sp. 170]|uniref:hypothetical protein n=1 Tax=Bradyrhizobium sp. 170 TaxID=2782641 RepID=UPI0020000F88|nr:hypothetical protein [Bradyrhizobium sp. 170]UPK01433.1 hypothetical protein IVB05_27645 [Bradyrhizobium sp. 170]
MLRIMYGLEPPCRQSRKKDQYSGTGRQRADLIYPESPQADFEPWLTHRAILHLELRELPCGGFHFVARFLLVVNHARLFDRGCF